MAVRRYTLTRTAHSGTRTRFFFCVLKRQRQLAEAYKIIQKYHVILLSYVG